MGVVATDPIQVIAEAYDVALDMSFPKGKAGEINLSLFNVSFLSFKQNMIFTCLLAKTYL